MRRLASCAVMSGGEAACGAGPRSRPGPCPASASPARPLIRMVTGTGVQRERKIVARAGSMRRNAPAAGLAADRRPSQCRKIPVTRTRRTCFSLYRQDMRRLCASGTTERSAGSGLRGTRRDDLPDLFDFGAETVKSDGFEALLQQSAHRNGLLIGEFLIKPGCGNHEDLPL